jgi:hypothetical protein
MAGKKKKPDRKKPRKSIGKKPNVQKRKKPSSKSKDYVPDRIISPFDQQRRRAPKLSGSPPRPANNDEDECLLSSAFEGFQYVDSEDIESDAMSEAQKKRDDWTRAKLKEIFNAEKWIDRTAEMKEKWKEITPEEKKLFDFTAAYSEACRVTMKRHMKPDGFDL